MNEVGEMIAAFASIFQLPFSIAELSQLLTIDKSNPMSCADELFIECQLGHRHRGRRSRSLRPARCHCSARWPALR
jgi:hypothetical protein